MAEWNGDRVIEAGAAALSSGHSEPDEARRLNRQGKQTRSMGFIRDPDIPFFELKYCNAGIAHKQHFHEEYSLGYIEQGETTFLQDGRPAEASAGMLVLIPPYMPHSCQPRDESRWRYKMLFVQPGWVRGAYDEGRSPLLPQEAGRVLAQPAGSRLRLALRQWLEAVTPLEREISVAEALGDIWGSAAGQGVSRVQKHPGLERVRDYLHAYYRDKVTLEQLEQVAGIGKYRLIRLFKAGYALAPHTYQILLRINYAKRELRGCRSIAAVAQDAGFYDQSHFIKAFRGYVGVTPEAYRIS